MQKIERIYMYTVYIESTPSFPIYFGRGAPAACFAIAAVRAHLSFFLFLTLFLSHADLNLSSRALFSSSQNLPLVSSPSIPFLFLMSIDSDFMLFSFCLFSFKNSIESLLIFSRFQCLPIPCSLPSLLSPNLPLALFRIPSAVSLSLSTVTLFLSAPLVISSLAPCPISLISSKAWANATASLFGCPLSLEIFFLKILARRSRT